METKTKDLTQDPNFLLWKQTAAPGTYKLLLRAKTHNGGTTYYQPSKVIEYTIPDTNNSQGGTS